MRSANCATADSVYSVGTTGWLAQIVECHPAKGVTYRFSCDFVNRGNATRVGIAVKPDMNGIAEVYSSARSGTLTLDVEMTNYTRTVGLYFYSNFTSSAVSSEAEFTNIVFAPISLLEEGMACVPEEKFRLDDKGQVTIPVPRYSPITINAMDGSVLTATYNRDISKYFATPEYVDGLANKTLVNAKEYTNSAVEQGMGMALMNAGTMDMQVLEDAKNYADAKFNEVPAPQLTDKEATQVKTVYKNNPYFDGRFNSLTYKPTIPKVVNSVRANSEDVPNSAAVYTAINDAKTSLNKAISNKLSAGKPIQLSQGIIDESMWLFALRMSVGLVSLGVHYIDFNYVNQISTPAFDTAGNSFNVSVSIKSDGTFSYYKNGRAWTSSDGTISLYGAKLGSI
jgi:hypothetical protein